jgi:hypothetical protein
MMVDNFVQKLINEKHELVLEDKNDSYDNIYERIKDGFVLVKFTKTRGTGTEVGINIDHVRSDLTLADFNNKSGMLHLEGTTTINYVPVRCILDVNLATKTGEGHLEIIDKKELISLSQN